MQHLFICGCPRSGTTAMQWILNQSREICIGGERYAHRFWSEEGLKPEQFERDRFFDQQDGDTFYPIAEAGWWADKQSQWPTVRFIGDKLPLAYMRLPMFEREFPDAKIIVMVRNIFDVASSYRKREADASDSGWQGGGIETAVFDWNQMFEKLLNAPAGVSFLPVSYEQLFLEGKGLERIVDYIGLDCSGPVYRAFAHARRDAVSLEQSRRRDLSAIDAAAISATANFYGYRLMLDEARTPALDQVQGYAVATT